MPGSLHRFDCIRCWLVGALGVVIFFNIGVTSGWLVAVGIFSGMVTIGGLIWLAEWSYGRWWFT